MKKIISLVITVSVILSSFIVPTKAVALGKREPIPQAMAYEYLEVINSIIDKYGVIREDYEYLSSTNGLFYADLLDFDGDNIKELFCICICDGGYKYEIWKFENDKVENICSKYDQSGVLREMKSVSLITIDGKSHVLEKNDSFGYAGIDGAVLYTISGVKNDNWVEKERLEYSYLHLEGEDNPYRQEFAGQETGDFYYLAKNGERSSITEEEYIRRVKEYESNLKSLLSTGYDGADTFEIQVDISENNKNLDLFMESLSSNLLRRYVNNNADYNNVKHEIINGWTYYEVKEEDMLNITRKLFGIELLPKIEEYGFIKLNGKWYAGDTASGEFNYESAQPVKMYELGNGMYYVQINYCAIYDEYKDVYFDKDLLNIPMEKWDLDPGLKVNVEHKGYAIIKETMVGGKKGYNLLKLDSHHLLTEQQIQKYIKRINPEPNITFDYSKVKGFKESSEYISFFEETLKGLSGQKPNDSGNSQIVAYIQYAIENSNITTVKSKGNKITIDNSIISTALSQAEKVK